MSLWPTTAGTNVRTGLMPAARSFSVEWTATPVSSWNTRCPTIGPFSGTGTFETCSTRRDTDVSRSRRTPVSTPSSISSAATTCSVGALPVRSPSPFIELCTTVAPPLTAATTLPTAWPKSSWLWNSSGNSPNRAENASNAICTAGGVATPKVSTRTRLSGLHRSTTSPKRSRQ